MNLDTCQIILNYAKLNNVQFSKTKHNKIQLNINPGGRKTKLTVHFTP